MLLFLFFLETKQCLKKICQQADPRGNQSRILGGKRIVCNGEDMSQGSSKMQRSVFNDTENRKYMGNVFEDISQLKCTTMLTKEGKKAKN